MYSSRLGVWGGHGDVQLCMYGCVRVQALSACAEGLWSPHTRMSQPSSRMTAALAVAVAVVRHLWRATGGVGVAPLDV